MAHRMHRGMSAADVLRNAEGERMQRALQQILSEPDGGAASLRVLLQEPCAEAPRKAAFDALIATASGEAVAALHELSLSTDLASGLDLYGAARQLPLGALLPRCCDYAGSLPEASEALQEAGLVSVGDLVRYCTDTGGAMSAADAEGHVGALSMELFGVIDKPTLRALVAEAHTLCEATAKLPRTGADAGGAHAWDGVGGGGTAVLRAWGDANDEAPADDDASTKAAEVPTWVAETSWAEGAVGGAMEDAAALMAAELGGGGGGGGREDSMFAAMTGAMDLMKAELGGGEVEVEEVSLDKPGMHSVGC